MEWATCSRRKLLLTVNLYVLRTCPMVMGRIMRRQRAVMPAMVAHLHACDVTLKVMTKAAA